MVVHKAVMITKVVRGNSTTVCTLVFWGLAGLLLVVARLHVQLPLI